MEYLGGMGAEMTKLKKLDFTSSMGGSFFSRTVRKEGESRKRRDRLEIHFSPRNSRYLIADGTFGQSADKPWSLLFVRLSNKIGQNNGNASTKIGIVQGKWFVMVWVASSGVTLVPVTPTMIWSVLSTDFD